MDLTKNTPENVEYMVNAIKDKLRMMNIGAVKSSHFNVEMYEDLKFLYDLVMKKNSFSPSEMEAIAEELGNLKK
ncbi:DUF1128 domain-containing protein [Peribacillus acanthi]|uniref:DUF1128 domain-containing protein n=1 Tax=Peribacillus acanthi TaxID=2171554 RepID=UPI000D3E857B|nr:DUF1128 domain-containing protein [Peribacillus acanthi]